MLERMRGPLCEAVLDQPGTAAILADLAESNLLLVPLDRRGKWYHYHHLAQGTQFKRARSIRADRCRAAPAAAHFHPLVVSRDRPGVVPGPLHDQDGGKVDLPQTGRLLTEPGRRPVP